MHTELFSVIRLKTDTLLLRDRIWDISRVSWESISLLVGEVQPGDVSCQCVLLTPACLTRNECHRVNNLWLPRLKYKIMRCISEQQLNPTIVFSPFIMHFILQTVFDSSSPQYNIYRKTCQCCLCFQSLYSLKPHRISVLDNALWLTAVTLESDW